MRRRLGRRAQLVKARTRAKNEVHAALVRRLVPKPKLADLFGQAGRRWLEGLELPAEERETVDGALRQVDFLEREIAQVEALIAKAALESPEARRLMTVPGVNVITAATFLAAIGDVRRFRSPRKLVGYLGLDPRVRQSGAEPAKHGHISKQGSTPARYALVEASWSVVRQPGPLHAFYERIRARRGHQVAIVASARKARLPVLAAAHQGGGLRLRAAVADAQEAAPTRAPSRGAEGRGQARDLGGQQGHAPGRARTRATGRACLPAHRRRLAGEEGRERDTGTRIFKAV
jgi:transposase